MSSEQIDVGRELVAIKKLLILALSDAGMKDAKIAGALGIHRTGVARLFPKGVLAEGKRGKNNE